MVRRVGQINGFERSGDRRCEIWGSSSSGEVSVGPADLVTSKDNAARVTGLERFSGVVRRPVARCDPFGGVRVAGLEDAWKDGAGMRIRAVIGDGEHSEAVKLKRFGVLLVVRLLPPNEVHVTLESTADLDGSRYR